MRNEPSPAAARLGPRIDALAGVLVGGAELIRCSMLAWPGDWRRTVDLMDYDQAQRTHQHDSYHDNRIHGTASSVRHCTLGSRMAHGRPSPVAGE